MSETLSTRLPVRALTLYKHGVGFFERGGATAANEVALEFAADALNDVLKSLTVIDHGAGQVLGIDYPTPRSDNELLAGCSIRLNELSSSRDLVRQLRGRQVAVTAAGATIRGTMIGLDETKSERPLKDALVTLFDGEANVVHQLALRAITTLLIEDDVAETDLNFFLKNAIRKDATRSVAVRLSDGDHDLQITYVAPAPSWRVSYRLLADGDSALLLGWGLFDNLLDEDLDGVALRLVAGMPISFNYDLQTPKMPVRPTVEDDERVAAAPVMMEAAAGGAEMARAITMDAPAPKMAKRSRGRVSAQAAAASQEVSVATNDLGELFEYEITTPVSVRRGHSAMVPIVSATVPSRKVLIYNGQKMPDHPVATLFLKNESGVTLEKGPVTVLDDGQYVGEAVMPFTESGADVTIPYAVELGVDVSQRTTSRREQRGLSIEGELLIFEEWVIRETAFQVNNRTADSAEILLEHPRNDNLERFDSPEPVETTANQCRFATTCAAQSEQTVVVRERQLRTRREAIKDQNYARLEGYLKQGLLKKDVQAKLAEILTALQAINDNVAEQERVNGAIGTVVGQQADIRANLTALSSTGKEGAVRLRYVEQLEASEAELAALRAQVVGLKSAEKELRAEYHQMLKAVK